jgi:putative ABC transport system permease protein
VSDDGGAQVANRGCAKREESRKWDARSRRRDNSRRRHSAAAGTRFASQRSMQSLVQDLRFGLRSLRKSPGFTVVAVVILALGIGANTAIFSVIDGVLLTPLPYKDPQQLVVGRKHDSLPNVIAIRRQVGAFSQGGAITVDRVDYTGGAEPLQIRVGRVDAGYLETLGVPPLLGRILSPAEDVQGGPRLAVVSHAFWQAHLGGDQHALGAAIELGGKPFAVIGVMPASFLPPAEHADVFVSLQVADPNEAADRSVHSMHTYWRLKPGVTLAQAQSEVAALDRRLAEQYPADEKERRMQLAPLQEWLTGDVRPALLVLFGAVGLVLLIACANFAGLLMVRAVAARHELVIRAALGAGRGRLIRRALTESTLLSLLGGAAGVLLAWWGTSALLAWRPENLARLSGIQMDTEVLAFGLAISLLTGVVFGIAPAWLAARADVSEALKESGRRTTANTTGHRLRNLLVTFELAIALILLVGAGLLIKGFSRLRSTSPGFHSENVTTMYLQLPAARYREIPRQTAFRRQLLTRLNSLPDVEAAMVSDIPLGGNYVGHRFLIDGRPPLEAGAEPEAQTLSLMGDYFDVMQIALRAGRKLTADDREGQPLVAIVNEEMVRQFFPHENPIGARLRWAGGDGPPRWMTVVGVAGDVKHSGVSQPTDPAVYTPFAQNDEAWRRFMTLAIRSRTASHALVEEVKKQIWTLDGSLPVSDVRPLDELVAASLEQQRFNMLLLGLFAALALILAAVGIYGAMSQAVNQRTHEIGIRTALGAQRGDVLRLVLRDGAAITLLGIASGIAGSLALTRLMAALLFEVKPTDPATFAIVAIALALVALAACYLPARRALRVDPMVALRHE